MAVLAADEMEGRETGTRGFDRAARYVASEFERLGLSPLSGSYLQRFTIRRAHVDEDRASFSIDVDRTPTSFVYGTDFVTYGSTFDSNVAVSADCVFVGDGVTAVEHRLDAYRGLDVRGKVAVAIAGAPALPTESERSLHASAARKIENAADHGAAVLIIVDDAPWDIRVRAAHQLGATAWLPQNKTRQLKAVLYINDAAAARLLVNGADATATRVGAVLGKAHVRLRNVTRQAMTANVVGMLRGADPRLSGEHIVVTAHLDHVGIGVPVRGDAIYNGAVDNASGVAALLAIAAALRALPTAPARSIVFVATAGEEQGEIGSDYLVHHPPVPIDEIVADVNIDGISFRDFREVEVGGGADSSLGALATEAAAHLGLQVNNTSLPFGGSDHGPFLSAGIPSLWIIAALSDDWMNTTYHTPSGRHDAAIGIRSCGSLYAVRVRNAFHDR